MATIPPNNNTGLYGIDGSAVAIDNNVSANNITATGNLVVGGNATVLGTVTANAFAGNGSQLSNLNAANISGSLPFADQANYANIANSVSGSNVSGAVAVATFANTAGTANTANSATTATFATSAGTANTANTATSATTAVTVTGNAQPNITSVGTLSTLTVTGNVTASSFNTANGAISGGNISAGNITASGNITGQNIQATGDIFANNATITNATQTGTLTASGNITGAVLKTSGATGNIVGANYVNANYFVGDGSLLTNLPSSSYGNAEVADYLASGTLSSNVITTGNITGQYILGNGSQLTGLPATYSNANVTTLLAAFGSNTIATTGNITAGNIIANGQALTNLPAANIVGTVANATFATSAGTANSANAVAGANVSGQVANALIAGTVYTNAQPNITSVGTLSSLTATGNITGGNLIATQDARITGDVYAGTYYGTFAGNISGNLVVPGSNTWVIYNNNGNAGADSDFTFSSDTSALTVTGNITGGNIVTAGNVSGSYIFGNGSQLTGLPATYSDSNVTTLLSSFGSNSISTTGNVSAGNFAGNGSQLSAITGANVTGTVANATFATSAASATTAGTVTTNAQPNITSVGTLSGLTVSGNIGTGGILTNGYYYANGTPVTFGGGSTYGDSNVNTLLASWGSNTLSTTGNVSVGNLNMTGRVFDTSGVFQVNAAGNIVLVPTGLVEISGPTVITGGQLTTGAVTYANTDGTTGQVLTTYGNGQTYFSTVSGGSGSPGGANTQLQFNDGGAFAGNAAMTFDKTNGNISFGNLVIGNIGTSGTFYNVLTNKNPFVGNTTTQPSNARILVGSGKLGDWGTTADVASNSRNARMVIMDEYIRTDNGVRSTELAVQSFANLNGVTNYGVANANSRIQGVISDLYVANGNTISTGNPYFVRAGGFNLNVGTSANTGNANISMATALSSFITLNTGSSAGNAISMMAGTGASNGTANTQIGYGIGLQGLTSNTTGNVFGVYMPGGTTVYGPLTGANTRAAANYYFLRCDDDIAQNKLGSLRTFHEFQFTDTISSGVLTINKTDGQVQYVDVTEAITSVVFSNFVTLTTQTSPAVSKLQADTVTVILRQDATGRTVTMPTGSAYKYAGGGNVVGTTANSVTMVSITGIYNSTAAATEYLITISPEFS